MKKILYIMPVDWGWIVQRPHFLALELAKYYNVKVVYLKQYIKRWKSQTKLPPPQNSRYGIYFPKQESIGILQKISDFSMKKAIGNLAEYSAVMIGEPQTYRFLEGFEGKVIYDCMDNYEALQSCSTAKHQIKKWEEQVLSRADRIFVSSLKLKNHVEKQCSPNKIMLVRNGYNLSTIYAVKAANIRKHYQLGYIGTISSWLNFELLEKCLDKFYNLAIHLIGPTHGYSRTKKNKLIFEGTVEHNKLFETIAEYDCLIMPFILNDIVLAVDPVKLYEYISFGKCIVSVYYEEIERFKDFVYFYESEEDFFDLIDKLCRQGFPPKYSSTQQRDFLAHNSWAVRGRLIDESLKCIWDQARSN